MKLYYAIKWDSKVQEVESERQTDKSVFINGSRSNWHSDYGSYFLSWQEAKDFLIKHNEGIVQDAKKRLQRSEEQLEKAKSI